MATAARSSRKPRVLTLKITGGPTKGDLFRTFQVDGNVLFTDSEGGHVYTIDSVKSLSHHRLRRSNWELIGTVYRVPSNEIRQFRMKYNTRTQTGTVQLTSLPKLASN